MLGKAPKSAILSPVVFPDLVGDLLFMIKGGSLPLFSASSQPAPHANKGSAFGLDCSLSGQAITESYTTPTAGTPRKTL